MGGSKNKSPSQKEKSQKKDVGSKKSKKPEKTGVTKTKLSVIIDVFCGHSPIYDY
jgi:hypothetical protein